MHRPTALRAFVVVPSVLLVLLAGVAAARAGAEPEVGGSPSRSEPLPSVLTPESQTQVRRAVDNALIWLAKQQQPDGSFPSLMTGQPGVTGLCALAFLSRGHVPGEGLYGDTLDRSLDYVIACQHMDGLISKAQYNQNDSYPMRHAAPYNHAIGGLMLGEVYGMTRGDRSKRIPAVILKALSYSREWQFNLKRNPEDNGGWRYLRQYQASDSDLSVTAWQLMFYRSAKNAGFDVPVEYVDDAVAYVTRCYEPDQRVFLYGLFGENRNVSRAMTGAGILSLALSGKHDSEMSRQAGAWVLEQSFDEYNGGGVGRIDRYHYSAYYCSQAMFQLGGDYWTRFYPPLAETLLKNQRGDGSWDVEARDAKFGNAYSTSLAVLTLTPPYQLLPIYQR